MINKWGCSRWEILNHSDENSLSVIEGLLEHFKEGALTVNTAQGFLLRGGIQMIIMASP